jgi:cell division protein FtsQ
VWDNPRQLNLVAGALVGIAMLVFTVALAQFVLRSPHLPVREIRVTTPLEKTSKQEIERATSGRIAGNIFAVDPDEIRAGLQQLPWVRRVTVRRVWPDRLEIGVEEHVALARWGSEALVNTHGERFAGKTDALLPVFVAPQGSEAEVARRYASFAAAVAPLGARLERVVLTPRLAWQIRLANGMQIMLGRDADQAEVRLRRFAAVHEAALKTVQQKHEYVDLRYPNGFALRVPGLKG